MTLPTGPIRMTPRHRGLQWLLFFFCCWALAGDAWESGQPGVVRAEFLVTLLIYAVLFLATALLTPKPKIEDARPQGLGDFAFPTASESRKVPIIWGTVKLAGPNIVWYGDLVAVPIKKQQKTGMFSSTRITVGFQYYVGIQFGLCEGQVDSLRAVYIGDTLVYSTPVTTDSSFLIDLPQLFGGNDNGNGGVVGTVSFYRGSTTQAVNPYLATQQDSGAGTDRTPRYTKTCYCVFERGYIGNSTQIKPWAFEVRRIPNGLGLGGAAAALNGGNDANPMNVAFEIMTDTDWGFAFPAADIDLLNFIAAAATLASENNGFSFVLDRDVQAGDVLREIERQIDGVFFLDHRSGKWKVKLARADYDVTLVPQVTKTTNIIRIEDFTRGSWEDTTNQIRIVFNDRAMAYTDRTAFQQDTANALLQGGGTVTTGTNISSTAVYPGVKDADLAASIATRELRHFSYPLAKARFICTQDLWDVTPGDVIAFTDVDLALVQLPMRAVRIDYGNLSKGQIVIDAVQDVFQYAAAAFGSPPPPLWNPPSDTLAPFVDTSIFEAPRAFLTRNPDFTGAYGDRIWTGGARVGNEFGFKIDARISPAAFVEVGDVQALLFKCDLTAALVRGAGTGITFTITALSAADKSSILAAFAAGSTPSDIGTNLLNLILIESEFFLVTDFTSGTGNDVTLTGVYRTALDSVQADHPINADVFLLFAGGGLTDSDQAAGSTYDVKLLPYSTLDQVLEGSVTATVIAMTNRLRRPYPPARVSLNGTLDDTTNVSLEGAGSGDTLGIAALLTRRDYRTTDEVQALGTDAATLFADFPTLNSTAYTIDVRNDPAGANTLLFTTASSAGPTFQLERNDILQATGGVLPTTLGIVVHTTHTYEGVSRTALYDLAWAFTVTSGLAGQFNFGALDQNVVSALYTATQAGTYAFTVNTAFATGQVEYRLNGGAFTPLIVFPATSGSILGVLAADTIELRHTSSSAGSQTFLAMNAPGAGQDGYGVIYKP